MTMLKDFRGANMQGQAECARALEDILKLFLNFLDTHCSLLWQGAADDGKRASSATEIALQVCKDPLGKVWGKSGGGLGGGSGKGWRSSQMTETMLSRCS